MKRQRGFTLLEVIVAFALLALALTLLLGSLSGAARQVRAAEDASRATLHAQSLFARIGVGQALQPGLQEGQFEQGRYRWRLSIAPYLDPLKAQATMIDPGAPQLLQLDLAVQWGDAPGQRLRWQTLRLAPTDPNRGQALP